VISASASASYSSPVGVGLVLLASRRQGETAEGDDVCVFVLGLASVLAFLGVSLGDDVRGVLGLDCGGVVGRLTARGPRVDLALAVGLGAKAPDRRGVDALDRGRILGRGLTDSHHRLFAAARDNSRDSTVVARES
jgi:hypothetical protein